MSRTCTVCCHPERNAIDAALAAKAESNRDIARRLGLSWHAVGRHAAVHLPAQLAKATEAEAATDASTLLGRVERLERRAWQLLDLAEEKARAADATPANLQAASALVGKLTGVLELLGRVSGELVERRLVGHVHRVEEGAAIPPALALQLAAEEVAERASELDEHTRRGLVVRLLEPTPREPDVVEAAQ